MALWTSVLGCFELFTCTDESCAHPKVEPSRTLSVHLSRDRDPSGQTWDSVLCRFPQDFGHLFDFCVSAHGMWGEQLCPCSLWSPMGQAQLL